MYVFTSYGKTMPFSMLTLFLRHALSRILTTTAKTMKEEMTALLYGSFVKCFIALGLCCFPLPRGFPEVAFDFGVDF